MNAIWFQGLWHFGYTPTDTDGEPLLFEGDWENVDISLNDGGDLVAQFPDPTTYP